MVDLVTTTVKGVVAIQLDHERPIPHSDLVAVTHEATKKIDCYFLKRCIPLGELHCIGLNWSNSLGSPKRGNGKNMASTASLHVSPKTSAVPDCAILASFLEFQFNLPMCELCGYAL